jgi:hypothetical protein
LATSGEPIGKHGATSSMYRDTRRRKHLRPGLHRGPHWRGASSGLSPGGGGHWVCHPIRILGSCQALAVSHGVDGARSPDGDSPGAVSANTAWAGIADTGPRKVWAFSGDGENGRAGSRSARYRSAGARKLDNLVFCDQL